MSVLAVEGLTIRREGRVVVEGVSFAVARAEVVALMGPSGSGKTSILRAIAGLDAFDAGSIDLDGVTLKCGAVARGPLLRELHRKVGMVFQFHHLFAHMTALHNVWLAPVHVLGKTKADAEVRARELLDLMGVGARGHAMPHELSGGEAQRVAIARALAVDPPLLLMDEPTASLDRSRREELAGTLRELLTQGRSVVIATHDTDFARVVADRVVVLEETKLVREGTPASVLE